MTVMGTQGAVDVSACIVGNWSDVNFITPIAGGATYNLYNIGNVEQGVLEMMREDYIHVGTALPRVADYITPIKAGMKFTGQASEFNRVLISALIGDSIATAAGYVYPGTQGCSQFFTLQALRKRACDGLVLEARIFKVHPSGMIQIGSGDQGVMTPIDLEGLDDSANVMNQGGSSSAPLGFLWVPASASAVKQSAVTIGAGLDGP